MKKRNRKRKNPQQYEFTGKIYTQDSNLQLFKYRKEDYVEISDKKHPKDLDKFIEDDYQYWLNIHGIHAVDIVKTISQDFDMHALIVDSILDVGQVSKFQEFEKNYYFSITSLLPGEASDIHSEQISFVLGNNYLVTFQEKKGDHFNHIRERIREGLGIIRERKVDYLLVLLLEAILDNYQETLEAIEKNEENVNSFNINIDPSPEILHEIEIHKGKINHLKRSILPIKEIFLKIERERPELIQEKHIKYYVELKDFCNVLLDNCDRITTRLESASNLFFSIQSHRMNQVMKTLTVVSTIFIPLSFVVGIYGMNFSHMPELEWRWGYLWIWVIIITIISSMILYFKKKHWF